MDDLLQGLKDLDVRLARLSAAPVAVDLAEGLADVWVDTARDRVGVDTGQTRARTRVRSVAGGSADAVALVESDTPYAGYHEYGNSVTPPRRYFRDGRDAAREAARRAGNEIGTEIERVLISGGTWNPHAGWVA